jgi:5'-nucleotidase/UDP-sugar diphosphatase
VNTKLTLTLLAGAVLAIGCNSNKKTTTPTMHASALDVTPAAPAVTYTPPPAPQPVISQPAADIQPVVADSVADASDTITPEAPPARHVAPQRVASHKAIVASSSAKGTKYTIKKGDSLWSIAKSHYGDGNKWKQIASANPKLNPNKVVAGTTITLP